MTEYIPIGSFTIFTNTETRVESYHDSRLQQAVSDAIVDHFNRRLKQFPNLEQIFIVDTKSEIGCILTTVTLGVVVSVAGAIYVFVKDYDKIKSNLGSIIKDFKNAYLKIVRKNGAPDSKPKVEFYAQLPDDLKKYYNPLNDTIIYSSKEETVKFTKICVMKDDIITILEEETVKSKIVILKKRH